MADIQNPVNYSTAIAAKYPEAIVIAIVRDGNNVPNPITLGWSMVTSGSPSMLAISVGLTRYSCENIRRAKEFVISFPSEDMAKDTLFFGTRSGRDVEKIKEFGTPVEPCHEIDGVMFANAVANFECRLAGELVTGDHVIFAGEVVASSVNSQDKKRIYTLGKGYGLGLVSGKQIIKYHPDLFKK